MSTPILPFAVWESGTNQNSVPANDNSLRNQILNGLIISDSTDAQPGSPAEGDIYIITGAATGAQWATFDEFDLTIFDSGTWYAFAPVEGVVVNLAGALVAWDGAAYTAVGGGGGGSVAGADKQVQYNNAGAFGAEAGFEYDAATNTLTVSNITTAGLALTAASATGGAGFRLPHGAAPTAPVDGDVWTTSAGGMYARINGVTVGPLGAGGGGLTNWTDAVNTSAPNATIPAVSMTVTNAATNVDAVIASKGTGAFLLQVPDNTATGGNKRGSNAIDLQMTRSANTAVANGQEAFAAGSNNTASAARTVAIGQSNTASGANSFSIGQSNTNSATNGIALGNSNNVSAGTTGIAIGRNHTVTVSGIALGQQSTVSAANAFAVGYLHQTDAQYAVSTGGQTRIRGVYGMRAHASAVFATQGDAQHADLVQRIETTNATITTLTSDQGAAAATNQMVLPNNSAYIAKGIVVAREAATGDTKSWEFTCHIKRGANAAATAVVAAATVTVIANDAGAAAWALTVDADTTNGALRVRGTGEAAKTIKWVSDMYAVSQVVG